VFNNSLDQIRELGCPTIEKIHTAGICTLEALAITGGRELSTLADINEARARELYQTARQLLEIKLETVDVLLEKRKTLAKVSTDCQALDIILGGGVETQAITELVGEFGSSKTQICHTLCVTAQLPKEQGGLGECHILYIDTEGTFRPERIWQIAQERGLDPDKILRNISVARAYSSDHLAAIVDEAFRVVPELSVKLITADSVTAHFRPEHVGRELLAERQQKFNSVLGRLLKLAEAYNVVVVVTNQVIAQPGVYYGNPDKLAGGHITTSILRGFKVHLEQNPHGKNEALPLSARGYASYHRPVCMYAT